MSEVDTGLLVELLRRIQTDISDIKADIGELKSRATAVEEHLFGIFIATTGTNNRMERLEQKLGRIEKRLDLTDVG